MFLPRATPALLMRIVGSPTSLRILAAVEAMRDKEVMSHL
jgi:hypothetical protein